MSNKSAWREAPFSMLMATFFGVGHIPGGPGTYAAIIVTPLLVWMSSAMPLSVRLGALLVLTALGCYWSDVAEHAIGKKDSRRIVLDEVIGVYFAVVWWSNLSWSAALVGLIAFRVFDMWKPYPIPRVEKAFKGGVGVVMDDVVAGWMASLVVWAYIALV